MKGPGGQGLLAAGLIAVVATAVALGMITAGSPKHERLRRLDAARIDHLRSIGYALDGYWSRHKALPASLEELARDADARLEVRDPETRAAYEYHATGGQSYELCATFALDSAEQGDEEPGRIWAHAPGRHCFAKQARPSPTESSPPPARD